MCLVGPLTADAFVEDTAIDSLFSQRPCDERRKRLFRLDSRPYSLGDRMNGYLRGYGFRLGSMVTDTPSQ